MLARRADDDRDAGLQRLPQRGLRVPAQMQGASRGRVESGPILPGAEYGHFAKKRLTLS